MKVLLDECVPRKLKAEIANHEVSTVTENGWSGLKNGELLGLAEAEFDVFLTTDQNLSFQQNLPRFNIGVVVLAARNTRFKTLVQSLPAILEALDQVKPGELLRVECR